MIYDFPLTYDTVTRFENAGVTTIRQLVQILDAMKLRVTVRVDDHQPPKAEKKGSP